MASGSPRRMGRSVTPPQTSARGGTRTGGTPVQVNSAAWLTLINGANGIEWFCDDSVSGSDACAGGGRNGHAVVQLYVPYSEDPELHRPRGRVIRTELNVASASRPRVRSSNAGVPIHTMVKVGERSHLPVRGVGSQRVDHWQLRTWPKAGRCDGEGCVRLRLPLRPTVLGAEHESHLSSNGSFRDGFGAHGDNYQVKVYKITK